MKLRNKETGEIRLAQTREDGIYLYDEITKQWYKYELSLLAEYWEYYEEPKEYWYIDLDGEIIIDKGVYENRVERDMKEIGNRFETKEEAEKAVEKLKAWKRLKDKGFRFKGFEEKDRGYIGDLVIYARIEPDYTTEYPELDNDLDLLFGGEE